jgi:phosphoglycerate dehydrogenase-like enzyme
MPRLLVISPHARQFAELLDALSLPELDSVYCSDAETAKQQCADAEILFGAPDLLAQLLDECTGLRWLQSSWAGVKPLLDRPRRDYRLTGVKGIFGPLMAEYVLGWLLALERSIPRHYIAQKWDDSQERHLLGKTLGIMGTGSIGSHVARCARVFGLTLRGLNSDGRNVSGFDRCYSVDDKEGFAAGLDYLVALLPDTPASDDLVDQRLLSALNPGALLVNGGRANCIVEQDLIEALENGQLRHAVIDVLSTEPLPEDDPLWQIDNLTITSHTAAPTRTEDIVAIFCENYRRYLAGQPLLHEVDFDRGY